MKIDIDGFLNELIKGYNSFIENIHNEAKFSKERAYGGVLRSEKGSYVEELCKQLILFSWKLLGNDESRLSFNNHPISVPIKKDYIKRIKSPEVREYIERNINKYEYKLKTDIHIYIDNNFKIAVECKSYTENAMLKRILVDFTLLKNMFPELIFVLFQLESQLGGDYSENKRIFYGSPATHTLLSYFDIDLNIITLLEGERKVDEPIHDPSHHKHLKNERLKAAIEVFKTLLSKY